MPGLLLAATFGTLCQEAVHVYRDFYALAQAPFDCTPDPQFLFLSASHKATLGALAQGIASRQGFIVVYGAAGVGKTTLLRAYLTSVKRQALHTIFVDEADLTFADLLRLLFRELGLTATTDNPREMVQHLQQMLAGAASPRRHIVLVGQPALHQTLAQDVLPLLEPHITIRTTVLPLTRQESLAYIRHRLAHVTQDNKPIFTPAALRRIVRQARGVPREVNTLCTEALMAGCAAHQKPLTAAFVQGVIADSQGGRGRPVWRRSLVPATALALLGGLLWLAPWPGRHDTPSPAPQATRAPGSDRPAKETMVPAAPTVPRQVAEVGLQEGAQGAHSPALRPQL